MDLAYTNRDLAGFTADDYEPEIVNAGTSVGVVYRGEDCVAFSYDVDAGVLEIETDESFFTFTREGV